MARARGPGAVGLPVVIGVLAGAWLCAVPALASDGVREIDRACAIGPGCFSGDAPGLPVTIDGSAGRSYRLTTDLTADLSAPAATAILDITTSDVTVDLNGFTVATCLDTLTSCAGGQAAQAGILGSGPGIAIRNGRISGFVNDGIRLPAGQALIQNVLLDTVILREAIFVGPGSILDGVGAGSFGTIVSPLNPFLALVGPGSIVRNSGFGLFSGGALRIEHGSLAHANTVTIPVVGNPPATRIGIQTASDARLEKNVVIDVAPSPGVDAGLGVALVDNVVRGDVRALGGGHVQGNAILLESGTGATLALSLGAATTYRENIVAATLSTADPVGGSGFLNMGENTCDALVASCP